MSPENEILVVYLPQDAWPEVRVIPDDLGAFYELVSSPIDVVRLKRNPETGECLDLVVHDEGRLLKRAPNPWVMLLGRQGIMGHAVLVASKDGENHSLRKAWAEGFVGKLTKPFEPFMQFIPLDEGVRP